MHRLRSLSLGGRLLLALAVGGALFGIASAVQASIPDSSGVIHGCYNISQAHGNPTGALRVIDTAKPSGNCASWEAPLNPGQGGTGASGPSGPTGATGPTGTTGPAGPHRAEGNERDTRTERPTGSRPVRRAPSGIYRASGYLNGVDGGSSPEVTSITRQSVGIFLIHFSVDVSACGRVATLGIPSNQREQSCPLQGVPG